MIPHGSGHPEQNTLKGGLLGQGYRHFSFSHTRPAQLPFTGPIRVSRGECWLLSAHSRPLLQLSALRRPEAPYQEAVPTLHQFTAND